VIRPSLDALFVGINPGLVSARVGHHFGNPANRFWRLLHESGFTPRLLAPHEDGQLLGYGLGITNVVARASAGVSDLAPRELLAGAGALDRTIARFAPRSVVFVGVMAFAPFARRFELAVASASECGERAERHRGARLFVLPNPSGRNAHFTYAQMLALYRSVAHAVRQGREPKRTPTVS